MNEPITRFLAFAAFMAGACFFLGAWDAYGPFSAQVAAWVQGIGSVGAIVSGFAIARRQAEIARRSSERDRSLRRQAQFEAVRGILRSAVERIEACVRMVDQGADGGAALRMCSAAMTVEAQTLAAFAVDSLPSAIIVQHFNVVRGLTAGAAIELTYFKDRFEHRSGALTFDEWNTLSDQLKDIRRGARTAMIELEMWMQDAPAQG